MTRFGGGALGTSRARAAALMMLALPGSPYLYAGDELGLPQAVVPDEAKLDPIFWRSGGARAAVPTHLRRAGQARGQPAVGELTSPVRAPDAIASAV